MFRHSLAGTLCTIWLAGCPAVSRTTGVASSQPSVASPPSVASQPAAPSTDDRASGAVDASLITLPDTMGKTSSDAERALRAAGVREIRTGNDPGSINLAVARVCSQTPGGGQTTRATLPVVLRYCDDTRAAAPRETRLVGLPAAEAQRRARAAGFTGDIEVLEITSAPECAIGTVCRVEPQRWELDQDHRMTLYVAKKLAIRTPD